jgi:hypothetical protein
VFDRVNWKYSCERAATMCNLVPLYVLLCVTMCYYMLLCVNFFQRLEGKVQFGKVNCDEHHHVCVEAGVRAYPSIIFYRGATNGRSQVTMSLPLSWNFCHF